MPTQRYKLTIAYRGTRYHGWQQQPALASYKGERDPGLGVARVGPVEGQAHPAADGESIPTIQGELKKAIGEVVAHPAPAGLVPLVRPQANGIGAMSQRA